MYQRQIRAEMTSWSQRGKSFRSLHLTYRRPTRASQIPELYEIMHPIRKDWHAWHQIKFLAKISKTKIKIKVFPLLTPLLNFRTRDCLVPRIKKLPNLSSHQIRIAMTMMWTRITMKMAHKMMMYRTIGRVITAILIGKTIKLFSIAILKTIARPKQGIKYWRALVIKRDFLDQ